MKRDEYTLGDDLPKKSLRDDRLGYAPFAERLANVIFNISVPDGYVIGLHGKWGSGKTTVVNFILEHLKTHNEEIEGETKKIEHVDFRPWIVSGHQDLMAAFFKLLSEELKPKEGKVKKAIKFGIRTAAEGSDKLVEAAAKMALAIDPTGGVASGVAGNFGKATLKSVLRRYLETPSLEQAYNHLKTQLANSGRRFVVTVDDIDRLEDEEIKSIMQMVKTVGRLPNVIYLLVYDRDIVYQALDEKVDRVGPRFAEKIVQQEVELPLPDRNALLTMLDEEIKFIISNGQGSTRWQYIVRDGVQRWINSPRDVLRYSNALKFAWPALNGEFDAQDLVAVEGLRLFDPIAFDWIRRNRDFLFNQGRYFMGAEDERKANVEALKASLPTSTARQAVDLLTVLFPSQGKWLEDDGFMNSEDYVASQARRGIASEAGYDTYFALRPSVDAIPKSTIDFAFENLSDEKKLTNVLRTYIGKNNSRGQAMIGLFLNELRIRFGVHPRPQPTEELLKAVLSIGEEVLPLPWRGGMLELVPGGTLRFLVKDILEIWGEEEAGKRLMAVYKQSNSAFVLAEIYVDRGRELGVFPSESSRRPIIKKDDFDELGAILISKIQAAVDDGSLVNAPYYWDVARSWKHLGDHAAVKAWLSQGMEADGKFTAKVIKGMVSQSFSGDSIRYTYGKNPDEELYDTEEIYKAAKRQFETAKDLTSDERSLLKALIEAVDHVRAGKSLESLDADYDDE